MRKWTLAAAILAAHQLGHAAPSALNFAPLDMAAIEAEDSKADQGLQPHRYAIIQDASAVKANADKSGGGQWQTLKNGKLRWTLPISAEGAVSIDVGFKSFFLPQGAELRFRSLDGSVEHGPYSDAQNPREGGLWLPIVPGDKAILELTIDAEQLPFLALEMDGVGHGYREMRQQKSGTCNVDTICSQGDAWRDQISAVGAYAFSGGSVTPSRFDCTGTLINRVGNTREPLFLTANHCLDSQAEASTVVVYWKYESSTCRAINSAANGTQVPVASTLPNQSGTTLLATYNVSDFTLLRLNQAPPAAANVYWAGWDRRDTAPVSATTIHHPQGHEKRISFENNPLEISGYLICAAGQGCPTATWPSNVSHWRVNRWDVGTTEPGSSGSALFSPEKRIIGQLHGGYASCTDTRPDWYGRLAISWDGNNSATTRLRDHLDPGATGAQTLDGTGLCAAPTVSLTANSPAAAGTDVSYSVTASGGSGSGYTYAFDIDGDGNIDRTSSTPSIVARYNREQNINVSVRVRDGAGCEATAQRAMAITAHRVQPSAALAAPTQVCGDGDAVVEPGERWRLATDLINNGQRATTAQAVSLFTKTASDALAGATRDQFGYAVTSNASSSVCNYQFVDITDVAAPQSLTPAGSAAANDDGRTAVLDISGNNSFNFYGQSITQAVMSTNGYLGTSAATTGGDFNNLCGLTPDSDNNGRRLQVLHDDLVAGSLRAIAYPSCPRPSEVAPADQRCLVFQWNNMGVYTSSTTPPTGNFDFQVIIYPTTWQIVYQYRNAVPSGGNTATVGILNPGQSGQQLNFSCNQNALAAQRAVCFYHPQKQPGVAADLTKIRLENPVVNLGALNPAATQSASTIFAVEPTAACGSRFRLGLAGTADENSGNVSNQSREIAIGADGNCQVAQNCPVALPPTVSLRPGAFLNPRRDGNGVVAHVIPQANGLPSFFAAWYTGTPLREPTWYIVSGVVQDNQVVAPIQRATRNLSSSTFSINLQPVGTARIHLLGNERLLFNYVLDASNESGSELLTHGLQGVASASPNRTGTWFFAQEDGWGQTYDSYLAGGVGRDFIATYLYDTAGNPRWVLTDGAASDSGDLATQVYSVHCPSCGWISFLETARSAGTLRRSFLSPSAGNLSTNFTLPAPMSGTWTRNNVPIVILTPPQ